MWIVKMNMPLILMSLVGAGMIVIVILLKKGFGRFLPQRLFPLLWICVLIRLLIPFSISSPLNLTSFSKWGNWAEFRTFGIAESTNVVVMDEAPAVQKGTQTQTSVTNEISEQIAMQAPAFQLNWNIETIYTTGVLATGIFLIWRFIQTRRKFDRRGSADHFSVGRPKGHSRSLSQRSDSGTLSFWFAKTFDLPAFNAGFYRQ